VEFRFGGVNNCIYYDLDDISADDVRRARAAAPGAAEFIASGTVWPSQVGGPAPGNVPNSRDFGYQEQLMNWVNRLFKALEDSPDSADFAFRHGASLLEIARYGFFFDFTAVEQRWRAAAEIWGRAAPSRIVWVAPAGRRRELNRIAQSGLPPRIELVSTARPAGIADRIRASSKELARPALDWIADRMTRPAAPPAASRDAEVIFTEFYANNAKVLLPVAGLLQSEHGIGVFWLSAREQVSAELAASGVPSRLLREVAPAARNSRGHLPTQTRRRFAAALAQLPNELYSGTGGVANRAYLQPALERQLGEALNEAAYWLDAYRKAFHRLQPRCVVSTSYSGIVGRAAAVAARRHGARSVYMQHGSFHEGRFLRCFCNDLLLLWGDDNRRAMIECGIEAEQVKVIGATIYDDLIRRGCAEQGQCFPSAGEPLNVAFMASRTGGLIVSSATAALCLSTVAQAIEQVPNARLIIKVHPGDKTGMIEQMAASLPKCTVSQGKDSQQVIGECDVAIVVSSTTGLEACIAGKPLIVLHLPGLTDAIRYGKYGAALEASVDGPDAADTIARAIRSLAESGAELAALAEGRRRLVDDMLNGGRGNAAELAARAIADLAHGPNNAVEAIHAAD